MAQGPGCRRTAAALAACLESRRDEILATYARHLEEDASPLATTVVVLQQAKAHASEVLDQLVESLRAGSPIPAHAPTVLAKEIGTTRAAQGTHPGESMRASATLFRVLITASSNCLSLDERAPFPLAVQALHEAISLRLENATTAYYGFLLDRLSQAHGEERLRLARELHDRVSASLGIAYRQLELHDMSQETGGAGDDSRLETARGALVQAMEDIRQLVFNLRSAEPVESLEKALRNYVDSTASEGLATEVIVNGDESWAPLDVRTEVFLIVREALRNALRHGHPAAVRARIHVAPHALRATVDDDGAGFDPRAVGARTGTGLPSMAERVALLGGTFRLSSLPGKGTQVEVQIPLGEEQNAGG